MTQSLRCIMNNTGKIDRKIIIIVCALIILALFFLKYLLHEKVQVRVAEAALRNITQSISYSGSIESRNRVRISSEIAGRVAAIFFKELDEVHEGQVLVKLEDVEIKAQLNRAKEVLNQAEINLINVKKDLNRVKKLFEKGFASKEQLDSAQQAFDVGKALVKQNQSSYEVVHARLGYASVRAPISGTIIGKNVTIGEIVAGPLSGMSLAVPTAIVEIADLNDLEVRVDVDEVDIGKVKVGQEATISVDAFPDKRFRGGVKEIALMTSGRREIGITYQVKVHIEHPETMLKLGMTANVDFVIKNRKQVLSLPRGAIIAQGGKIIVFTVNDQKVEIREIVTGVEGEEFIEVTSGLQPGERVVVGIKTKNEGGMQLSQGLTPDDIFKLTSGRTVVITP